MMSSLIPGSLTPVERSKRSILVGNIPGDASEDQLRNLLLEFGSIVNFRFFNDSAGNQIGYAFCEYDNQEMAVRAIHKLNNLQFKGQVLKVDTAASDKSKEELEILLFSDFLQGGGPNEMKVEGHSELDATTEKAPEEISKAVASLPPEQMFELMKQMKMCIENNPHEARNLLLQNPQLAYALLQAQVIMRIVDPEVALKILDRPITVPTSLNNTSTTEANLVPTSVPPVSIGGNPSFFPSGMSVLANIHNASMPPPGNLLDRPGIGVSPMDTAPNTMADKGFPVSNDQDMRQPFREPEMRSLNGSEIDKQLFDPRFRVGIDPRMMQGPNSRLQDLRMMQGPDPRALQGPDPRTIQGPDPRSMQGPDPRAMQGPDPRTMQGSDPRTMQGPDPRAMPVPDPRAMRGPDPRALQGLDPRVGQDPRSISAADPRTMRGQDPRVSQLPDPRMMQVQNDPRMLPGVDPRMVPGINSKVGAMEGKMGPAMDPRTAPGADPRMMPGTDPRMPGADPRMLAGDPRLATTIDPRIGADPRARQGSDPRIKPSADPRIAQLVEDPRKPPVSDGASVPATRLAAGPRAPTLTTTTAPANISVPPSRPADALPNMSSLSMPQDQEKAALIMQVLQLSDEQIAMLPPDQRQSILILKEQIARSHLA